MSVLTRRPTAKELDASIPLDSKEKIPIVERPTMPEMPPEVEKVESVVGAEISLPQPVTDDSGQVIIDTPEPQEVVVALPLTENKIVLGAKAKISDSFRWLTEYCQRLAAIVKGKFRYKYNESGSGFN